MYKSIKKGKISTQDMVMCAMFTALITVGAFIRVPIPYVPFTLQFLFTMLAGLVLGARLGAMSVFAYIVIGLIGLPVFTEGGGLGYIFKPTFGYIIGFCIATYITGKIANTDEKPSIKRLLIANFVGLFIVYALGMVYFYGIRNFYMTGNAISLYNLFLYCFVLAIPGDIFLCIISAVLAKRIIPYRNANFSRLSVVQEVI